MNTKLLATLLLTAATAPAWAVPITVTSTDVVAAVYDGFQNYQADYSTSINHATTLSASVGNATATTDITWTGDDNGTAFRFDTAHSINNSNSSGGDSAKSRAIGVSFTANETINYGISGFYTASGGEAHRTYQDVFLQDLTTGEYLFYNHAYSDYVADESFTLGDGIGGDSGHEEYGSLTGSLIAGHSYELSFQQFIQDPFINGIAGSAVGQICLITGNGDGNCGVTAPEPMSLSLLGLGLLGISLRRKEKS